VIKPTPLTVNQAPDLCAQDRMSAQVLGEIPSEGGQLASDGLQHRLEMGLRQWIRRFELVAQLFACSTN